MAVSEKDYLLMEKGKSKYMLLKSPTHFHMIRTNGATDKQLDKLMRVYPCDCGKMKKIGLHVTAFRCESLRRVVLSGYEVWDEITFWIGGEARTYILSKTYSEENLDEFFREQQRSWQFMVKPERCSELAPELIHTVSLWVNVICMVIPTLFFFSGEPNKLYVLLCVLCQLVPVILVCAYPESFTLLESRTNYPKQKWKCPGSLMAAFLVPGFGLALRVFTDFTFFDGGFWKLIAVAGVLWLLMMVPLFCRSRRIREDIGECIALTAMVLFLNLGVAGQLNYLLDFQPVRTCKPEIVQMDKHVGVKSTSYSCTVIMQDGERVVISVPKHFYQHTSVGQNVNVTDHKGAFGIRFLQMEEDSVE